MFIAKFVDVAVGDVVLVPPAPVAVAAPLVTLAAFVEGGLVIEEVDSAFVEEEDLVVVEEDPLVVEEDPVALEEDPVVAEEDPVVVAENLVLAPDSKSLVSR